MKNFFDAVRNFFTLNKSKFTPIHDNCFESDSVDEVETDNYKQQKDIMSDLCITDVIKLYNVINCIARGDYSDLFEEMVIEVGMEAEFNAEINNGNISDNLDGQLSMEVLDACDDYETIIDDSVSCTGTDYAMGIYSTATSVLDMIQADLDEVLFPLRVIKERCSTDVKCPHCGRRLYLSDLKQYDYICPDCDENFYSCEVVITDNTSTKADEDASNK